jgi:hypothetical protein
VHLARQRQPAVGRRAPTTCHRRLHAQPAHAASVFACSARSADGGLTLTSKVHFRRGGKGRLELAAGPRPVRDEADPAEGRVPKVARLLALAIRLQGLLDRGEVKGMADLARAGHVTRARVTQVMNLLMLAPDVQEAILMLPPVTAGRDPVKEWQLRPVAAEPVWAEQRRMWRRLTQLGH